MIVSRWMRCALGLGLTTTCSAIAHAAVVSPASAEQQAGNDVSTYGDIVVTANKRSERVNDVGMSITAVTGLELARQGVKNPEDLGKISPGLVITRTGYNVPVYTLRGVGFYDNSVTSVPAVSVYVDQVPFPYSITAQFAALDVERVEVLKGPQGTLYGINSTGGAVNFIAAKPTSDLAAGLNLTAARFGAVDVDGYVSGPLSSNLRVRLAASTEQGGAWQTSITRGEKNGARDRSAARLLLDWTPAPDFSALLSLTYGKDNSDSIMPQFQQVTPLNPTHAILLANRPAMVNLAPTADNARLTDWNPGGNFQVDNKDRHAALTLSYDISDHLKLKSLTSYQDFRSNSTIDVDGTTFTDLNAFVLGHVKAFYQELALYGQYDRLNWIIGGNYMWDSTDQKNGGPANDSFPGVLGSTSTTTQIGQRTETKAVFVSGDYKLTDQLTAQAGIRYTDSTKKFRGCSLVDPGLEAFWSARLGVARSAGDCITLGANGLPDIVISELSQDNIAWRAGLNWKFDRDSLVYANVSHGYKSGGFPLLSGTRSLQYTPVTQEDVLAYEVGAKIRLSPAVRLNAALFRYDYTDKQVRGRIIDPTFGALGALINVPKSRINGVEAQMVLAPLAGLDVSLDGTYLDSKIKGNFSNYDFLGSFQLLSGEALPFTPKFTGAANVKYTFAVSDKLNAEAGFVVNHQSSSNAGLGDLAIARIKPRTTLDLSAGIGPADDKWHLTIWGRNVTNEYYWTGVSMVIDIVTRNAAMPATYGATLSLRY
ncbi:TonB-dependent receptor [Sphingobium sp.]|uniref:TonB-dependent receptor n=1 Tax=Sphingobium sp. TaxID=1912891 RepID=UPI0028BEDBE7|nr:TonB-dependent receptor [Sphingobium sp.]